jgi:hypothetical protein
MILDRATLNSLLKNRVSGKKVRLSNEFELDANYAHVLHEEKRSLFKLKPADFIPYAFRVIDKDEQLYRPFSFKGCEYWEPIYNSSAQRILLKTGRQVAKSTTLGNRALTYCCLVLGFKVLYVAPSLVQVKEFTKDRIKEPIETSEVLAQWTNHQLMDNAFTKKFVTGSEIIIRSAFLTADRIRGVAGIDCLIIDEIQDILKDNIPVIEQTAFTGSKKHKVFLYAGTPKSLDNPIEERWTKFSTQNVWAIPCHRHSFTDRLTGDRAKVYWNVIQDEKCLGKKGLICEKCGELINYKDPLAHWTSLNPQASAGSAARSFAGPAVDEGCRADEGQEQAGADGDGHQADDDGGGHCIATTTRTTRATAHTATRRRRPEHMDSWKAIESR